MLIERRKNAPPEPDSKVALYITIKALGTIKFTSNWTEIGPSIELRRPLFPAAQQSVAIQESGHLLNLLEGKAALSRVFQQVDRDRFALRILIIVSVAMDYHYDYD